MSHVLARIAGAGVLAASVLTLPSAAAAAPTPGGPDVAPACIDRHGHAFVGNARPGPGAPSADPNTLTDAEATAMQRALDRQLATRAGERAADRAESDRKITVPVVIHEVQSTRGTGQISDETWARQIREVNQNFNGGESPRASQSGFRFELLVVNEYVNNNWFRNVEPGSSVDRRMKRTTRQGGYGTLNVWSVDPEGLLGFATFPSARPRDIRTDGIVINYGSVPGGYIENYNLGKTLTHEAGHWLGLFHTFQGGCTADNDFVNDTPAQSSPTFGCPVGRNSCFLPGLDPIRNYMDYSYDGCYNQFTDGQSSRMQNFWYAFRA